jgi:hypothetical protein
VIPGQKFVGVLRNRSTARDSTSKYFQREETVKESGWETKMARSDDELVEERKERRGEDDEVDGMK